MLVHFPHPPDNPQEFSDFCAALSPAIQLSTGKNDPERFSCQVLVNGRPDEAHIKNNPNLSSLIIPFAGLPPETRSLCLRYPHLTVYNLHHNAIITAEMAITLMLSAARFVVRYDSSLRKADWSLRYAQERPSMLLYGKKVLLLGFGAIGKHTARICQALGMQVEAIKRHVNHEGELQDGIVCFSPKSLNERLTTTHVLMVMCPLTDETRGMIGQEQFHNMPPGGVLVNVGRAQIVDQTSFYEALVNGHLAAAGLDVWYNYPQSTDAQNYTLPASLPFWEMDQVILSPHRAGHTQETETLRLSHLAALLNQFTSDPSKVKPINLNLGY